MWSCARGHKDAMLMLNQWNPVALLGLADRCTFAPVTPAAAFVMSHSESRDADASSLLPDHCHDRGIVSPSWPDMSADHPCTQGDMFLPANVPTVCVGTMDDDDHELLHHVEQSVTTISYTEEDGPTSSDCYDRLVTSSETKRRTTRLKKRTSVDVLPSYTQRRTSTPKISKTASAGDSVEIPAEFSSGSPDGWQVTVVPPSELRVSNSDSHLSGLAKLHSSSGGPDPMISMIDHDINSPPMMFTGDTGGEMSTGFPLDPPPATYILPCESMAVDIGMFTVFSFINPLMPTVAIWVQL